MRKAWNSIALIVPFLFAFRVLAQGPVFAGSGPVIQAGIGYSYSDMSLPSASRFGLSGAEVSANAEFTRRFGVKLALDYSRGFNMFGTGHHADVLSYMGGPVLCPIRRKKLSLQIELLAGAARETGVNFATSGKAVLGFANQFAWAAGGGIEYRLAPSFCLHVGADYLHTSFFNPDTVVQGQNNIRSVVSVVYTFGKDRKRSELRHTD